MEKLFKVYFEMTGNTGSCEKSFTVRATCKDAAMMMAYGKLEPFSCLSIHSSFAQELGEVA